MYGVNNAFNAAAEANTRHVLIKALFNGSVWLTGDNLISMTVTEAVAASGGLSIGTTISSQLSLTFKMPETPFVLDSGIVEPYVGFYGVEEYCPLGKFYISKVESKGDSFTITAYDAFSRTEEKYKPTISMPNTMKAILNDIAEQCGFEMTGSDMVDGIITSKNPPIVDEDGILIFESAPDINDAGILILASEINYPEDPFDLFDFTCREYIGYFAGLLGTNARFNRQGELAFSWYTATNQYIASEHQYMSGFKRLTDNDFTVHSITSGTSAKKFTAGSGTGISFENPFMTQEILNGIAAKIGNPTFTPASVKWRGNPAIEAGDIVRVSDKDGNLHDVYIMEQKLRIGGGLNSEIKCYGQTDSAIRFDTSPTNKKIEAVYTSLQAAIAEATKLLGGGAGGIFEILDSNGDGVNDGWIIHSADDRQHIKANVNGIGITTDGGATYQQAMTPAGINASAINAGTLNAERIAVENFDAEDPTKITDYIRFADGTITLGKGSNAIILKLENDKIAFYDSNGVRKAIFTDNSFEIENLEEGKIRFQNFGYITRASGNLSFTKLI